MKTLVLSACLLAVAACTTTGTGTSAPGVDIGNEIGFADLQRDDYIVIDGVTGASRFSMTRWFFMNSFNSPSPSPPDVDETALDGAPVADLTFPFGTNLEEAKREAMSRAVHEALSTVKEADAMIEPRFTWDWEYTQFWPIYWSGATVCRVWGKAVRIRDG